MAGVARQFFRIRVEALGGLAHVEGTLVRRSKKGTDLRPMTFVMRDEDAMALSVCIAAKYGLQLEPYLEK
ncbi:hypothetical protein EAH89_18890 [Roseomonas nepalensis]|uniref:Uncharacterized protein n=1 Tax=Muricoccus nepalensis TaxID=1854500 RepID=A0A502FSA7_9PROT|nr:hypothetical protein EAH89_18890 [Roseomonas nepalensis]